MKAKIPRIASSEITSPELYADRRRFMQLTAGASLASLLPTGLWAADKLPSTANPAYLLSEKTTPYKDVTTYNNFYEFGTSKEDPARNAHTLKTRPWTITVDGEVKKPKTFDIDALLKLAAMEERVYRLRCVEAWSMVIPWLGYPLAELIKQVEPTSKAKFVEFITLDDPAQMPGELSQVLAWPYTEGLLIGLSLYMLLLDWYWPCKY